MADRDDDAPETREPEMIHVLFLTGLTVEPGQHVLSFAGWIDLPAFSGEASERRIVSRFVLPINGARRLQEDLKKTIRKSDGE